MSVLRVLILAIAPTKRRGVMSSVDRDGHTGVRWAWTEGSCLYKNRNRDCLCMATRLSESLEVDEGRKEGGMEEVGTCLSWLPSRPR